MNNLLRITKDWIIGDEHKLVDGWQIIKPDTDGNFVGDRFDYAVTAVYLLNKNSIKNMLFSLLTRRCSIYSVKLGRAKTLVVKHQGRFIDLNKRTWVNRCNLECSEPMYQFRFRLALPYIGYKLLLGRYERWLLWNRHL
tara:strand:- start:1330 stop:1746 length:417 start_codon:yes stop_codon:yes gene_type:complete